MPSVAIFLSTRTSPGIANSSNALRLKSDPDATGSTSTGMPLASTIASAKSSAGSSAGERPWRSP